MGNQHKTKGGKRIRQLVGDPTGSIYDSHDALDGPLLGAENGLFHFDGQRIFEVAGDPTGRIYDIRDAPDGLLLRADNRLFRYDGKRTRHVAGDSVWRIGEFLRRPGMRRLFLHTSRADATDRS
jgi:hypothetical protein